MLIISGIILISTLRAYFHFRFTKLQFYACSSPPPRLSTSSRALSATYHFIYCPFTKYEHRSISCKIWKRKLHEIDLLDSAAKLIHRICSHMAKTRRIPSTHAECSNPAATFLTYAALR